MAKAHEHEQPPPGHTPAVVHPAGGAGHGTAAPPAPVARVIPEYRPVSPEGPAGGPTRLADFPKEAEAGWKRWKVSARVPFEQVLPSSYVLAADEEAAKMAYRKHHALDDLPPDLPKKIVVTAKPMED